MQTAITPADKTSLINFIQSSDRYTCGPKVKEFEDAWSEWLGCKHSLYVTSGSTANLLLMASVKELYEIPNTPMEWVQKSSMERALNDPFSLSFSRTAVLTARFTTVFRPSMMIARVNEVTLFESA